MPKRVKRLQITLEYPEEVSYREIKEYAASALEHWSGQFHPDDPLFPSDRLRVVSFRGVTKRKPRVSHNVPNPPTVL